MTIIQIINKIKYRIKDIFDCKCKNQIAIPQISAESQELLVILQELEENVNQKFKP